ncbi:MAG TPA: hypothetical protein VL625_09790 [Patescibacteria group bacterium]|nr:hypothetical protein [Patescibacteria group bacterium]
MQEMTEQEFAQNFEHAIDGVQLDPLTIIMPDGRRLVLISDAEYKAMRRGERMNIP